MEGSANGSSPATKNQRTLFGLASKLILPILLAVAVHRYWLRDMDAPPADFGSGSMFDLIATRYDTINRVLAMGMDVGWRRRMARVLRDSLVDTEKPRLLDVATGTADVALILQKEIPQAVVVGVDPSAKMLQVGRDKIHKAGLDSCISLQLADAQDLETALDASSFDAATMAFGIRNVVDRQKAFCQIHSMLKDQARFCILEFSEPDDSFGFLGLLTRWFIRYIVPTVGGILSGAPREYWHLQNSIKDFPSPQEFIQQIEAFDCRNDSDDTEGNVDVAESHSRRNGGSFRLEELIQMNFGSVQLYVTVVEK